MAAVRCSSLLYGAVRQPDPTRPNRPAVRPPEARVRAVGRRAWHGDAVSDGDQQRTPPLELEPKKQPLRERRLRERITAPYNGSALSCERRCLETPPGRSSAAAPC